MAVAVVFTGRQAMARPHWPVAPPPEERRGPLSMFKHSLGPRTPKDSNDHNDQNDDNDLN